MFFVLTYFVIFMVCSYKSSATAWLKCVWFTNFTLFFYFIIKYTKELLLSNFYLVGTFSNLFSIGFIDLTCTYKIVPFNFTCILLVMVVSLLVQLYSFEYMYLDPFLPAFFFKLTFFSFSFLLLIMTDDLFVLLVAWEAVGLSSFLLISFYNMRVRALKASLTALLYNKIGDVFLMVGVSVLYSTNTSNISLINSLVAYEENILSNKFALFCFMVAGLTKSAQFIFHVWLPEAMEGPTPVSSLLHAATMVTAGVYLMSKIPNNAPLLLNQLLLVISAVTAFWCSFYGFTQTDIKKIIAYSTASQLAFMFLGLGMLRFDLGLFHLLEHGFFKAMLFLTAGFILNSKNDEQDTRMLGSFTKTLPFPFANLMNGFANLIATPCFAGFYSKELIVTIMFVGYIRHSTHLQFITQSFTLAAVLFTCMYTFKFFYLQFFNNQQRYNNIMSTYQNNVNMSISIFILFYLSFSGLFISSFYTNDVFLTQLYVCDFLDYYLFTVLQMSFNSVIHSLPFFLFIPIFSMVFYLYSSYFYLSTCFFYFLHDYLFGFFLFSDSVWFFKTVYASKLIDMLVFDFVILLNLPLVFELTFSDNDRNDNYTYYTILLSGVAIVLVFLVLI